MGGGGSAEDKDRWDSTTDSILRNAVDACGLDWVRISSHFLRSFNPDECRKRWKFLSPPLIKGAWSTAEDEALRQYSLTTLTHSTHRECHCVMHNLVSCLFLPVVPVPPPLLLLSVPASQCARSSFSSTTSPRHSFSVSVAMWVWNVF